MQRERTPEKEQKQSKNFSLELFDSIIRQKYPIYYSSILHTGYYLNISHSSYYHGLAPLFQNITNIIKTIKEYRNIYKDEGFNQQTFYKYCQQNLRYKNESQNKVLQTSINQILQQLDEIESHDTSTNVQNNNQIVLEDSILQEEQQLLQFMQNQGSKLNNSSSNHEKQQILFPDLEGNTNIKASDQQVVFVSYSSFEITSQYVKPNLQYPQLLQKQRFSIRIDINRRQPWETKCYVEFAPKEQRDQLLQEQQINVMNSIEQLQPISNVFSFAIMSSLSDLEARLYHQTSGNLTMSGKTNGTEHIIYSSVQLHEQVISTIKQSFKN